MDFNQDDLPDWLRNAEGGDADSDDSDLPDWLKNLDESGSLEDDSGAADLPDWLQDESVDASVDEPVDDDLPPAPAVEASAEDEEDEDGRALWEQILAEEGLDLTDVAEERPEGSGDMTASEWLIATSSESPATPRSTKAGQPEPAPPAAVPSETEPPPEPATVAEDDGIVDIDGLPEWLRDEAALETQEATDIPDWLKDLDEEEPSAAPAVEAAPEAPVALSEDDAAPPPDKTVSEMAEADGIPDWLREVDAEAPASVEAAPEAVAAQETPVTEDDGIVDVDGLPEWLRDEATFEAEAAAEAPDWLKELDEEETAPPPPAAPAPAPPPAEVAAEAEDVPEWLKEVQTETLADEQETAPVEEESLPHWLATEEPDATEAEHAPSWLREIQGGETTVEDVDAADLADIPDWLQGAVEEELAPAQPAQATSEAEPPEKPAWMDGVLAEEEPLPQDMPAEDMAALSETAPEVEGPDDSGLPDWLLRLREEPEAEEAPAPPAPEPVAEAEVEEAEVVEEEPPDWLRRLRESEGLEPEAEVAAPEPAPEAEGPDWLDDLVREEEALTHLPVSEKAPEPAPPPAIEPASKPVSVGEVVEQPAAQAARELSAAIDATAKKDTPEARLAIARAEFKADDLKEALGKYKSLINSSALLDEVIADLQAGVDAQPDNFLIQQTLGDALMKDGRLQEALDAYRAALAKLSASPA
ncbi:MAG: hypothetical protein ACE5H9_00565 [Anaerolineae bacterium]